MPSTLFVVRGISQWAQVDLVSTVDSCFLGNTEAGPSMFHEWSQNGMGFAENDLWIKLRSSVKQG